MNHQNEESFEKNAFFKSAKQTLLNAAQSIEGTGDKYLLAKAEGIKFAVETYEKCGPSKLKYTEDVLLFQATRDESRKDASGIGSGEGIRAAISVVKQFIGFDNSISH